MPLIPPALAATPTVAVSQLYNPTNISVTSKLSDLFSKEGGFSLINFVFIIIGLVFFANLVMAGWDFMMSSGDPKKVQTATSRIMNGLVGLVMAFAAFIIVNLITNVLGLGSLV